MMGPRRAHESNARLLWVRIDKTHREHNGSAFRLIATEVRLAMLRLATAT